MGGHLGSLFSFAQFWITLLSKALPPVCHIIFILNIIFMLILSFLHIPTLARSPWSHNSHQLVRVNLAWVSSKKHESSHWIFFLFATSQGSWMLSQRKALTVLTTLFVLLLYLWLTSIQKLSLSPQWYSSKMAEWNRFPGHGLEEVGLKNQGGSVSVLGSTNYTITISLKRIHWLAFFFYSGWDLGICPWM